MGHGSGTIRPVRSDCPSCWNWIAFGFYLASVMFMGLTFIPGYGGGLLTVRWKAGAGKLSDTTYIGSNAPEAPPMAVGDGLTKDMTIVYHPAFIAITHYGHDKGCTQIKKHPEMAWMGKKCMFAFRDFYKKKGVQGLEPPDSAASRKFYASLYMFYAMDTGQPTSGGLRGCYFNGIKDKGCKEDKQKNKIYKFNLVALCILSLAIVSHLLAAIFGAFLINPCPFCFCCFECCKCCGGLCSSVAYGIAAFFLYIVAFVTYAMIFLTGVPFYSDSGDEIGKQWTKDKDKGHYGVNLGGWWLIISMGCQVVAIIFGVIGYRKNLYRDNEIMIFQTGKPTQHIVGIDYMQ